MSRAPGAGEVVITANGVKIVGHLNVPGRLAASASALYARTSSPSSRRWSTRTAKVLARRTGTTSWSRRRLLTRDGAIVHPTFQPQAGCGGTGRRPGRSATSPVSRLTRRRGQKTRSRQSGGHHGRYAAATPRQGPGRRRRAPGRPPISPQVYADQLAAAVGRCRPRGDRRGDRPLRLPLRHLRPGDLRRLLRRLVGDAGAAHAADVGDQRHLLGDRRRRAARRRRVARPTRDGGSWLGARPSASSR